jgi:hypothetical protein
MKARGMKVVMPKLSKAEVQCRKMYALLLAGPRVHLKSRGVKKVKVKDVALMADVHVVGKRAKSTCIGKSSKKCSACEVRPNLLKYRGTFGKVHLTCPACGWTNRVVRSWADGLGYSHSTQGVCFPR